jgi:hypothetical protein
MLTGASSVFNCWKNDQDIARKLKLTPCTVGQRKAKIQQLIDAQDDLGVI